MKAKPIAGANAIDALAFVLVYAREFTVKEAEFLLSLEEKLKGKLPSFTKLSGIQVSIAEQKESGEPRIEQKQTQRIAGVLLQHFQENGKPDWALRVTGREIIVNCWKYSRWEKVWPYARDLLLCAAQVVDSESNGIVSLVSQVVDKFEYDSLPNEAYSITDIFRSDSPYLTKQVFDVGQYWHIHQGWFSYSPVKQFAQNRQLDVLNLSSGDANGKLVALIDHSSRIDFEDKKQATINDLLNTDENKLALIDEVYDLLHETNASILCKTLTDEKLAEIGLKR